MIVLEDYIVRKENKKSSRKLYKMMCDKCNHDRGYQRKSRHGLGLCKKCASSVTHKNKIVTEIVRDKMSKNSFIGNGGKHPMLGKKHTDATKAILSKITTAQNRCYQKKHAYTGIQGEIDMRSSWEVKYAQWLDDKDMKWKYEPKAFELSNGKMYTPDFELEDGTIIEIKGYFRSDARVKWDMFNTEYPNLRKSLLMKGELRDLGVL